MGGEGEAVGESPHVRIDHNAHVLVERVPQHDVGRLPPDAGEVGQLLHRLRHAAMARIVLLLLR